MINPLLLGTLCLIYALLFGVAFGITSIFLGPDLEQTFLSAEIATITILIGYIYRQR